MEAEEEHIARRQRVRLNIMIGEINIKRCLVYLGPDDLVTAAISSVGMRLLATDASVWSLDARRLESTTGVYVVLLRQGLLRMVQSCIKPLIQPVAGNAKDPIAAAACGWTQATSTDPGTAGKPYWRKLSLFKFKEPLELKSWNYPVLDVNEAEDLVAAADLLAWGGWQQVVHPETGQASGPRSRERMSSLCSRARPPPPGARTLTPLSLAHRHTGITRSGLQPRQQPALSSNTRGILTVQSGSWSILNECRRYPRCRIP